MLSLSTVVGAQDNDLGFQMQVNSRYSPHQQDKIDRRPLSRSLSRDVGVTVYIAKRDRPGPFIIVLGSGWNQEARLIQKFLDAKISVALVGGRTDVAVPRRDRVADCAKAIAYLYANADVFKTDGDFVILADGYYAGFGGSLGTDLSYLSDAGVPAARLRGVAFGLDGRTAVAFSDFGRKWRLRDFGADADAQGANTAIGAVAAPNAPAWLIVEEDVRSTKPSEGPPFVDALRKAGTDAELMVIPVQSGEVDSVTWGDKSNAASERLVAFVFRALGR